MSRILLFTGKGGVGKTTVVGGHRARVCRARANARSSCRPTPRTRSPTRSTSISARCRPAWSTTSTACSSTRPSGSNRCGATCSATSPRSWSGSASTASRPRSSPSSRASTKCSAWATFATRPRRVDYDIDHRGLRTNGRDDPVPVAARDPALVHRPRRAHATAGHGRAAPVLEAHHQPAHRRRQRFRRRDAIPGSARRRARTADRRRTCLGAPRGQPRAHGDRRGPSHRHLPQPVRLPPRRRRREPAVARRRDRPVVRTVEVDAIPNTSRPSRPTSRRCRSCARRWPTPNSSAWAACAASRRACTARRVRPRCCTATSLCGSSATASSTTLFVRLPFAVRDDLDVARRGNELLIRVGPQRRRVVLPDSLHKRAVTSAPASSTTS